MAERHTLLHEAAHQVVAHCLGWRCDGVTVLGGTDCNGAGRAWPPQSPPGLFGVVTVARPLPLWSETARRLAEDHVQILMAGRFAELLLADGPVPAMTAAEQITEQVAELPEPDADLYTELAAMVDEAVPSDEDQVAKMTWAVHHSDYLTAVDWIDGLARQVSWLVQAEAERIRHLADVLEIEPVLSGEAVAAILRDGRCLSSPGCRCVLPGSSAPSSTITRDIWQTHTVLLCLRTWPLCARISP
jgi:hypothetical protein